MANRNAGEDMRKAIAEGRAKQCTAHKKDGTQCGRVARDGYDVCSSHGAGTSKREIEGVRQKPGRPIETGLYARELPDDLALTYDEVFGDLTLVHEVALAKTMLLRLLRHLEEDPVNTPTGEGTEIKLVPKDKAKTKEDMYYLIKMLEAVTKTANAAFEQLQGKKITVTVQNDSEEIIAMVRSSVEREIAFMDNILCPDCRNRLADSLLERQRTVMENG
jgi:hypothetical protein